MIPVMSFHDILAIFVAGFVAGAVAYAFLAYKIKKFLKTKF